MNDYKGKRFGKYVLLEPIGKGSFAVVYRGRHVETDEEVAVKIFRGIFSEQESLEKLRREADICKSLNHPNIVRVRDFDVEDDESYLVMDYAPTPFLHKYPYGTALPLALVLKYAKQLGAALQYAHDKQVVHRDIKPANLLLSANEDILLADFGIARVLSAGSEHHTLTITGTPQYMAPEQFQYTASSLSDQYSLGVVVYEWLAGRRPFEGDLAVLTKAHRELAPASLSKLGVALPEGIEQAVLRALAKEPQERFPNVWAFVSALEAAGRAAGVVPALITRPAQVHPQGVNPPAPTGGMTLPEQSMLLRQPGQEGQPPVWPQSSGPVVLPASAQSSGFLPAAPVSQPPMTPPPVSHIQLPPVSPSDSSHGLSVSKMPPPGQVHLPPMLSTGPMVAGEKPQPRLDEVSAPAPPLPSPLPATPPPPIQANLPPVALSLPSGQPGVPLAGALPPPLPGVALPSPVVLPGSLPIWPETLGAAGANPPTSGQGVSATPPTAAPATPPSPVVLPPASPGPLHVPAPVPLFGSAAQPPAAAQLSPAPAPPAPIPAQAAGLPAGAPVMPPPAAPGQVPPAVPFQLSPLVGLPPQGVGRTPAAPPGAQAPTTPAAIPPIFGGGAPPGGTFAGAPTAFNNQVTLPGGQLGGSPGVGSTVLPLPPVVAGSGFERAVGTDLGVYRDHQGQVKQLRWTARSQEILSLDGEGMLHYWLVTGQRLAQPYRVGKGFWSSSKAYSKAYVACPAADGIHVWNVLSRPPIEEARYTRQRGEDLLVGWVADDTLLVSGGPDPVLHIWSKEPPGALVSMYQGHGSRVTKLAVSSNTNWVASGEESGRINVWLPQTGDALANYSGHQTGRRPVVLLEWSPDGSRVASLAEFDREVHVWEARSGQLLTKHRTAAVDTLVAWSRDSGSLASKHERDARVVEVWDASSGDTRVSYRCPGTVAALAWSLDGKRLAAACGKEIHVFDPRSGQQLFVYRGHEAPVTVLEWSPDDRLIASADAGDQNVFQGFGQLFGQRGVQVRVWQAPSGRSGFFAPLDRFGLWLKYMKRQLGGKLGGLALALFFIDFLAVPWLLKVFFPFALPPDVLADVLAVVALFGGLYSKELRRPLFRLLQALLMLMWGCIGIKLGTLGHVMWLEVLLGVVGFLFGALVSYGLHRRLMKRLHKV